MSSLQNILGDEAFDKFKKARFLSEEESKNDPETEPYRSKYKAREILEELNNQVKELLLHRDELSDSSRSMQESETPAQRSQRAILTLSICLDFILGTNFMDTEELSEGEDKLLSCLKRIADNDLREAVSLELTVQNYLGILWSQRDLEKSLEYLELADRKYHEFKQNSDEAPVSYEEQLEPFEGSEEKVAHRRGQAFESIHTHTLYYLAQVYAKQEKSTLSAKYCHLTLQRQLQAGDFNSVDWGLNAATLSQYYLTSEKFKEARHCLASGTHIFMDSKKNFEENMEEEQDQQLQREADLDRCWIKYGLGLLESSRDALLKELETRNEPENGEESGASDAQQEMDHNSDKRSNNLPISNIEQTSEGQENEQPEKCFEPFALELTVYEEKITDKLVRNFEEARQIFLFIVDKIKSAMNYYTLDSHAGDAIEIIQDHSKAYKLLAFFELDMKRQCIMHKRRIDMLADLLKDLNPQYYLLVQRQLMYELAEAYSTMVDLKTAMIETDQTRVTHHSTDKINKLISQSIAKYQEYIDSLKDKKGELPSEFPEGDVRPGLIAFFCMGRLYSKYLESNVERRIAAMSKSLECYKFLVDYCLRNPSAEELVNAELAICREMVELMPLKMDRLKQQQLQSMS